MLTFNFLCYINIKFNLIFCFRVILIIELEFNFLILYFIPFLLFKIYILNIILLFDEQNISPFIF
jgi:hypothetical protein